MCTRSDRSTVYICSVLAPFVTDEGYEAPIKVQQYGDRHVATLSVEGVVSADSGLCSLPFAASAKCARIACKKLGIVGKKNRAEEVFFPSNWMEGGTLETANASGKLKTAKASGKGESVVLAANAPVNGEVKNSEERTRRRKDQGAGTRGEGRPRRARHSAEKKAATAVEKKGEKHRQAPRAAKETPGGGKKKKVEKASDKQSKPRAPSGTSLKPARKVTRRAAQPPASVGPCY